MANPQQPELRRSEQTPALSPDAIESELESAQPDLIGDDTPGPIDGPPRADHDVDDQDKPDLDDVAEQLGTKPSD